MHVHDGPDIALLFEDRRACSEYVHWFAFRSARGFSFLPHDGSIAIDAFCSGLMPPDTSIGG